MKAQMRGTKNRYLVLGVAISALAAAGCGTRVSDARIVAAGNAGRAVVTSQAGGSSGDAQNGSTGGSGGSSTSAGTTGAALTSTSGSTSGAATTGGPTTSGGAPASGSGTAGGTTGSTGSTSGGGAPAASCTKKLQPVILGQTLSASGLVGAAIGRMRNGLALWAQAVNAAGGVQCHPVQLYQEDDGSDPSRVSSNFNDLVNNKHAVAIVGAGEPIAIAALRSAAEKAKIPVVGGDMVSVDWYQSPYLFPQGGTGIAALEGSTIEAIKATTNAKIAGILWCVEASVCTTANQVFPAAAKKGGVAAGPSKAVSLTQSDFTAECQSMKDAKVDVLFLGVDGSASTRVARNCASLGYHPSLATVSIAATQSAVSDPNLQQDGLSLGANVAPYTESDTAGGKEFQQALKAYAGNQPVDQSTLVGWSAGKLFEAAIARVSAQAQAGPITTAMVLQGLWKVKNETLMGLSPGVTFSQGGLPTPVNCYYVLHLGKNGFTAPKHSAEQCL